MRADHTGPHNAIRQDASRDLARNIAPEDRSIELEAP